MGENGQKVTSQLPQNLIEALGATPLSYLVPVQNLASLASLNNLQLPIDSEIGTPDHDQYSAGLKKALDSDHQSHRVIKQDILKYLSFEASVHASNLSFNAMDSLSGLDDAYSGESSSLFDGLKGLTREIVDQTPLIRDSQLLRNHNQRATEVQKIPKVQTKELQTISGPQKHTIPTAAQENDQAKKRKFDTNVQHLALESISSKKLIDLVVNGIKMEDLDTEYESSDLWIEWPNSSFTLSDQTLTEIQTLLNAISGTSLSKEIPLEVLERIQNLSMRSVSNANELDWTSTEGDGEVDRSLPFAHNALKAASLILTVLNLKRQEKKLYLESYLMESVSFVYNFVEDFALKIVALEDPEQTRKLLGSLDLVGNVFSLISQYIPLNQIDDSIITKLEYLVMLIAFTQCDKSLLFFKVGSLSLLVNIFQSKPDQRAFIIDEVLNNFDRLPTHKITSRNIKLSTGQNLQLFTVILLTLIENLTLKDVTYASDTTGSQAKTEAEKQEEIKEQKRFQYCLESNKTERETLLSTVASSLVTKIINNPTVLVKQQFELLVQDLLSIVTLPEWPGASFLLSELMKTMVYVSEDQVSIVETYLLEMIGIIGSKMLEIRGPNDMSPVPIFSMTEDYKNVMAYLAMIKTQTFFENCYDFFFTQWIEKLAPDLTTQNTDNIEIFRVILAGYYQGQKSELFNYGDFDVNHLKTRADLSYRVILLNGSFMNLYQTFLNHLLKYVDHPKIKSKTRALKNLALLIDKDPRLLDIPQIKHSLFNKINDPSALVKLAVLEIFDQLTSKKPDLVQDLYQAIILTNDKSTAVRIKSMKIARKMLLFTKSTEVQVYLLEKILRRLEDDEESVLELAHTMLISTLFNDVSNVATDRVECNWDISQHAQLLVALVNRNEKNWDLFESFLSNYIIRKTDENAKIHYVLLNVCSQITAQLFDFVVNFMDTERQIEVEQSLGLLSILSRSDIPLINQEQLLSLQTYLSSDHNAGNMSYYPLVILRNSLSHITSLREQFITDCKTSLLRRLTKFNTKELDQAIPSICILSDMNKDTTSIANAAASCLAQIRPYVDIAARGGLTKPDSKSVRLLYLLGSFGKYCDLEKNRDIFLSYGKRFNLKEKETILSLITKSILIFTRSPNDRRIRRAAVRNLIHICSTHPKLFTSEAILSVLDKEFTSKENDDFKEVMIQGLLEFLEKEEKDSISRSGQDKKSSVNIGLDVDVFHGSAKTFENDGICASLVQRYTEPVLELCIREDGGISFLAVKFLKFIVKLGFANPRICTPTVIALQASPLQYIRNAGLELHRELHEKHESLVDTSYIIGIKLAASFRIRVSPDLSKEDHHFFQRFYRIIEGSRSSKKKVFGQLIKYFNFDVTTFKHEDYQTLNDFIQFIAPNISEVDFETYEIIVSLIEGIDSIVHRYSGSIAEKLSEVSAPADFNICYQASILINLAKLSINIRHNYRFHDLKYNDTKEIKAQKVKVVEQKSPLTPLYYNPDNVPLEILTNMFNSTMSNFL